MWGRTDRRIGEYQGLPLFEGCSPTDLRRISGGAARLEARAGTVLVSEGRRGSQFVIVVAGSAEVWRGGRQIDEITTGGYFGEMALLRRIREPATVIAGTDMSIDVIARREFGALYTDVQLIRSRVEAELDERLAKWHQGAGLTFELRNIVNQPVGYRPNRPRRVTSRATRSGTTRCPTRR